MSDTAVWCLSERSLHLAGQLAQVIPHSRLFFPESRKKEAAGHAVDTFRQLAPAVESHFRAYDAHIFIMATGIVVRVIAPLLKSKMEDPAVVVVDEAGRHAVSLVSGHLGGANALAEEVAAIVGADPVITTATDVNGLTAFDTLARQIDARVEPKAAIRKTSMALLNGEPVALVCDFTLFKAIQSHFPAVDHFEAIDEGVFKKYTGICIITDTVVDLPASRKGHVLFLRPPTLSLGIGCNSGTSREEIDAAVQRVLKAHHLSPLSVCRVASADKKTSENGLREIAMAWKVPFQTYPSEALNAVSERYQGLSPDSPHAMKHLGAKGVAEPAALLAAGEGAELVVQKQKIGNVTVAVARGLLHYSPSGKGKLSIVGIGPGDSRYMTLHARETLRRADVIAGYTKYLALIHPLVKGKEIIQTGMTKEIERVKAAINAAAEGKNVALVASGDAGVYGLAGLALELSGQVNERFDIKISPGITAAVSAASVVGAPLTNDYITLSLSNLLTPTETVISRIQTAAASGMVTVIYNPKSRKRTRLIALLQEAFLKHRAPDTPVAIVTHALRTGQHAVISTLKDFLDEEINMNSIVIIGNDDTFVLDTPNGRKMVTRRGYERKTK